MKRLRGRDGYRLRVGRYRVLFGDDGATVVAIYIGKRETGTYRWERTMTKPVMFKTPNGEKMVILSFADYQALLSSDEAEDAADVAAFDEAMARLEGGADRRLTSDEMAAFYGRPGFLRGLRAARGLTQAEVATRVGIRQGFLSDIESGRRKGSPATLQKIADVVGRDATTQSGTT